MTPTGRDRHGAAQHRHRRMKKALRRFSLVQSPLGSESYIVPVASLATAMSEQGHNI